MTDTLLILDSGIKMHFQQLKVCADINIGNSSELTYLRSQICKLERRKKPGGKLVGNWKGLYSEFLASTSTDWLARTWNANDGVPINSLTQIQGSKDGDVCNVLVKKMAVYHMSNRLHLGYPVTSLDFCTNGRYVIVPISSGETNLIRVIRLLYLSSALHLRSQGIVQKLIDRILLDSTSEYGVRDIGKTKYTRIQSPQLYKYHHRRSLINTPVFISILVNRLQKKLSTLYGL
ncbi:hypothetical protein L1887_27108 [Cichorium endivia]|nr:hypothetical protein L1887_27108 [Cichorium endivia]